jgi:RNA polymerase sigma factor (sigma-70 family)
LCIRYCGNPTDAADVLHDGFIRIIRNLHTFRKKPAGNLEGWMRRIIVNTALNYLRDHSREKCFLDIDHINEPAQEEPGEDDFFTGLAEQINPAQVLDLVSQLTPGYRTVLNLYVFEGYSHREIAEMLNCSESNSKSQLSRARAMFREKVKDFLKEQKNKNMIRHETIG